MVNAVFEFGAGSTRSWTEINIAFQSQGYSCRITAYESYGKTFILACIEIVISFALFTFLDMLLLLQYGGQHWLLP